MSLFFVFSSLVFLSHFSADILSQRVGSWTFVITQTSILCVWLVLNSVLGNSAWDPQPFVLLNLCLSAQAAFTAPVR